MDKLFLKLWILTEVSKLDSKIRTCNTMEEGYELKGKLSILQEMFDFFDLKKVKDDHVVHSNYWSPEESLVEYWLAENKRSWRNYTKALFIGLTL